MYIDTLNWTALLIIGIAALIGALLVTYVCYVAAKRTHENEKIEAQQKAKLAGEDYPEYEIAKSESWYKGYKLAAVAITVLGTVVGFAIVAIAGEKAELTEITRPALAFAGALIGGLAIDKFIVHPLADNTFFENVETPLVEQFLEPAVEEVTDKKVTLADMSAEDLIMLLKGESKSSEEIKKSV